MNKEKPIDSEILETDSQTEEEQSKDHHVHFDLNKDTIAVREDPHSVYELVRKATKKKGFVLDPDFQRNLVWKHEQKSRFIESILLNFPIPPLYVNENQEGKWVVIDGRQRTNTLIDFLKNKFALKGLKTLTDFEGKKFDDLSDKLQSRIENKKIIIYILQANTPIEVVYELFDRINTGGTPLNRQEVRHCIFKGRSTELLKELSEQDYFRKAIDNGVSPTRMKDREIILRYIAFRIADIEKDYQGDLSDFVEKAMIKINKMSDAEIEEIKKDFKRVMLWTFDFFGKNSFRYPTKNNSGRGFINTSMFESICYFFSVQSDEYLLQHKELILSNYKELLANSDYEDAVRFSTGSKFRVQNRFNLAQNILGKLD